MKLCRRLFLAIIAALWVVSFVHPIARVISFLLFMFLLALESLKRDRFHFLVPFTGALLDALAYLANGFKMPVVNVPFGLDATHILMTSASQLKPLCDIFQVHNVFFSIGDVIMVIGWPIAILLERHLRKGVL